jgi:hypothetical protein
MSRRLLLSAALLASCADPPDFKEVSGLGKACIDGMQIVVQHQDRGISRLPYRVLTQGTDTEIDDWMYSPVPIAYLSWYGKFLIKEVQSTEIRVMEEHLYEFTLNECI